MKLKTYLLAAAATLAISPAANAYEGLYGAIGAGLNYMPPDRDFSNDGPGGAGPFVFDTDGDYEYGVGAYFALGYDWASSWRTEFELGYRNNDIDDIAPNGAGFSGWPTGTIVGDTETFSFMANLLYDLDFFDSGITPFVGGGIGFASVDQSITGSNPLGAPTAPLTVGITGSKSIFAYQGIAGIAFSLAENLSLDLSYRYFRTKKVEYSGTLNGAPAAIAVDNAAHSAFAGLRWNFGAAPPPPVQYKDCWDGTSVPVTAECPPEIVEDLQAVLDPIQFTVYFDYDKSNLTPQAADLVQEAAQRALQNNIDIVMVSGHTDTSGSSAYNENLSRRRAQVVYDALLANGVPADRITSQAFGETNLAKPTPDGVREPLNRRTEVVITFVDNSS